MNFYDLLRRLVEVSNMYNEEKRTACELIQSLESSAAMGTLTGEVSQAKECDHINDAVWTRTGPQPWNVMKDASRVICIKCGIPKEQQ